MKTIATFILVLFIGVAAQAQNGTKEVKVATIEMGIVTATATQEVSLKDTMEVARLYKRSDSKVKHALSFTTKRDAAKMA